MPLTPEHYISMYNKDICNTDKGDLKREPVDSSSVRLSSIVLGSDKIKN